MRKAARGTLREKGRRERGRKGKREGEHREEETDRERGRGQYMVEEERGSSYVVSAD